MTPLQVDELATRVSDAVAELRAGRAVVISEGSGVGYLAFAGTEASVDTVSWVVRHGSGFVCAAMLPDRARVLDLPLLSPANASSTRPRYAVSVDAVSGTTTGISASDRARTIALLADPSAQARDFTRPGHVPVECVAAGGVLTRPRASEGLVDVLRMANLPQVGGLCALVSERRPTDIASGQELHSFCDARGAALIDVNDLVAFREITEPPVVQVHTESYGPAGSHMTVRRYRGRSGATYVATRVGEAMAATAVIVYVGSGADPTKISSDEDLSSSDLAITRHGHLPFEGAKSGHPQVSSAEPMAGPVHLGPQQSPSAELPLVFHVLEVRSVLADLEPDAEC